MAGGRGRGYTPPQITDQAHPESKRQITDRISGLQYAQNRPITEHPFPPDKSMVSLPFKLREAKQPEAPISTSAP